MDGNTFFAIAAFVFPHKTRYTINDCGVCTDPEILYEAKDKHRNSVVVTGAELQSDKWLMGLQVSHATGGFCFSPNIADLNRPPTTDKSLFRVFSTKRDLLKRALEEACAYFKFCNQNTSPAQYKNAEKFRGILEKAYITHVEGSL